MGFRRLRNGLRPSLRGWRPSPGRRLFRGCSGCPQVPQVRGSGVGRQRARAALGAEGWDPRGPRGLCNPPGTSEGLVGPCGLEGSASPGGSGSVERRENSLCGEIGERVQIPSIPFLTAMIIPSSYSCLCCFLCGHAQFMET